MPWLRSVRSDMRTTKRITQSLKGLVMASRADIQQRLRTLNPASPLAERLQGMLDSWERSVELGGSAPPTLEGERSNSYLEGWWFAELITIARAAAVRANEKEVGQDVAKA